MQALINSLTERELNIVASMVDLDCLDYFPTIEQLVLAVEMFGYSEQDILDRLNSINEFVFEDDNEIESFFSSVDTEFFWREIFIVKFKHAEYELMHELFIHSVDTRVGF